MSTGTDHNRPPGGRRRRGGASVADRGGQVRRRSQSDGFDYGVPDYGVPDYGVPEYERPDYEVPDDRVPEYRVPEGPRRRSPDRRSPDRRSPGRRPPRREQPDPWAEVGPSWIRRMADRVGAGLAGRPLRVGLAGALVVLLIVVLALFVSAPGTRARPVAAIPTIVPGAETSKGAGTSTGAGTGSGAGTRPSSSPSTTVAAGGTPPSVVSAGTGCGMTLGGPTGAAAGPPAPVGKCTVLEIGDSLGNDIGWGLARHVGPASGLNLIQVDKSASGLAVPSFYDWPTELAADLRQYQPDLVLICLGGDDEQGMDVNGSAVQFPTAAWQTAYLARVQKLVSEATASGAFVLWVGLPIMAQPTYSAGVVVLNSLYEHAVAATHNGTFLPTWSLLANPSGAYQSSALVNGASAGLRQSDGIHLDYAGEDVVATYVLHQMATIYHVALTPTNPSVITGW